MTKRRKEKIIKEMEKRNELDFAISRAVKYGCLNGREVLSMSYADKEEFFGWDDSR